MRVRNLTDGAIGIHGVSIPAGQERNVRGFDPDKESNRVRIEAGDIEVAGHEVRTFGGDVGYAPESPTAPDEPSQPDSDDESPPSRVNRLFGG